MMALTVEQAAQAARVTPKTVRAWIRDEGCPVVQEGGKGAGNGALIDGARFPRWLMEHEGRRRASMADYFTENHPGHNPLREMVDTFRRGSLYAIAASLRNWADSPAKNGKLDYRTIGITRDQARAVAWQVYAEIMLVMAAYQVERFDHDLRNELDGDLDDWMSLLTEGDFRTTWPEPMSVFPEKIIDLMPPELREKLEATNPPTDEET